MLGSEPPLWEGFWNTGRIWVLKRLADGGNGGSLVFGSGCRAASVSRFLKCCQGERHYSCPCGPGPSTRDRPSEQSDLGWSPESVFLQPKCPVSCPWRHFLFTTSLGTELWPGRLRLRRGNVTPLDFSGKDAFRKCWGTCPKHVMSATSAMKHGLLRGFKKLHFTKTTKRETMGSPPHGVERTVKRSMLPAFWVPAPQH